MIRTLFTIVISIILLSCAPVLREEFMKHGSFDVQPSELNRHPVLNRGKLFILGGIIVKTTLIKEGSLIEAVYVPVDSSGYHKGGAPSNIRFMAIFKGESILDPLIFSADREITLAGEYLGIRKAEIGEMDYTYPFFEIKEIYLWEKPREKKYYRPPHYYPRWPYRYRYRYYDPFYDPWGWYY